MDDKTTVRLLMGNQALGLGAIAAGVNVVAGYPGTPSSEVLETIAKNNPDGAIHVEWSTNEKAALEVAAGAAYCGARALMTCKQVGLNVASDPLMSLRYVGVKGGLVLLVADDPGPISSQTEQDTRRFGSFSKVPVLDPSSPEEAYEMMQKAFVLSEEYGTPVIVRPTTRVCHGSASVAVSTSPYQAHAFEGFTRHSDWIIFPRRAYQGHLRINQDEVRMAAEFSQSTCNLIRTRPGDDTRIIGIATGGISYAYVREALERLDDDHADFPSVRVFKVGTPYPFPTQQAETFLAGLDDVIVIEELDHVLEDALLQVVGARHLPVRIHGKLTGEARAAGENSVESVIADLVDCFGLTPTDEELDSVVAGATACIPEALQSSQAPEPCEAPEAPARPPVLCAGCPHRASFLDVKKAMKGRKAFWCGDIGCYTLGNAAPLDMVDTCLCMGADITIAQGMHISEPDATHFSFIGDSTFFASGMTGVANAVYNGNDIVICVLDNSTTAMTGGQPHPGTGVRMTLPPGTSPEEEAIRAGERALRIPAVLEALGCDCVVTVDPFDMEAAQAAVRKAADAGGVQAIIFKSPCINLCKPGPKPHVDAATCTHCRRCVKELGCPAITDIAGAIAVDAKLCHGCGQCVDVCPFDAFVYEDEQAEAARLAKTAARKAAKRLSRGRRSVQDASVAAADPTPNLTSEQEGGAR